MRTLKSRKLREKEGDGIRLNLFSLSIVICDIYCNMMQKKNKGMSLAHWACAKSSRNNVITFKEFLASLVRSKIVR